MRALAVYFGLRADPEIDTEPSTGLSPLRGPMLRGGLLMAGIAIVGAVAAIVLLDDRPGPLFAGTALGIVIWGPMLYLTQVRKRIPAWTLPPAPPELGWEKPSAKNHRREAVWTLLGIAFVIGLVWFANDWKLSGFFVPGYFAGFAAATLYGEWRIRRWERRHDATAASAFVGGSEQFFAAPR